MMPDKIAEEIKLRIENWRKQYEFYQMNGNYPASERAAYRQREAEQILELVERLTPGR